MGLKFQNPSFNTMQNSILEQAKVDLKSDKFGSQLDKKNKTWFLTFPNVYVSWIKRQNSDLTVYTSKWGSSIVRAQKTNEKNGVISLVFISPSRGVMVLKCQTLCPLSIFCLCQQNILGYYRILCICIRRFSFRSFRKWCWLLCYYLEFNVSWTVAQTPVKNTILWKSMTRSFRWRKINCFNRFRFLADV